MWLRDSAHQLQSYASLLKPDPSASSLASLFRGAINLQARYILAAPHCNAFNAPPEADLPPAAATFLTSGTSDYVMPPIPQADPFSGTPASEPNATTVFECKYELDSLASFLQLCATYHAATDDTAFFGRARGSFLAAVRAILDTAAELRGGTYNRDGSVALPPYQFRRQTSTATETLANDGAGNPVKGGTGMVRSAFRPSDDACIYQLFVPANMMFSRYLSACARIVEAVGDAVLAKRMRGLAGEIRKGVERYGRVDHRGYGRVYAYEVDGYGGAGLMDDANIPSLLSAPLFGYLDRDDPIYQNTRRFVLSEDNPYFMWGPVLNSTGGPHIGPGMAWPMGLIVRILTSDDDNEIVSSLRQLLSSTDGYGLMHESVNTHSESSGEVLTARGGRFSWANGLFGQMILDLNERKPHLLKLSYQPSSNQGAESGPGSILQ
ncbi:hypothetical protein MMYC01_207527 [Madurella mycetomatis]|uniref:Meiotically up-regulated gene 157 protein n=1 Tax=Madurella mycetomatis TaxID=100816 RepID=A0A175VWY4_9PEZI|nr:hypothetical protein MMYC01_207527 [Madurella mycetomatis]